MYFLFPFLSEVKNLEFICTYYIHLFPSIDKCDCEVVEYLEYLTSSKINV